MLLVSYLGAVNHMPLLCTMYGEFPGAQLGKGLASLDFNGDGIDDLVIQESAWNPNGNIDSPQTYYGRLNFHWGGEDFNASFDASIHGGVKDFSGGTIIALGDINNDGKDDLGYYGNIGSGGVIKVFRIYFGRTEPSPIPDYELRYTWSQGCEEIYGRPLGDINADGYDDVGILVRGHSTDSELFILDGCSMNLIPAGTTMKAAYPSFISGIGDVNGDGYDDYLVERVLQRIGGEHYRITVFFGGENISSPDSLVITEDTNNLIEHNVGPLGDLNGDGIDDFLGWRSTGTYRIWYGSSALTPQWDLYIYNDEVSYSYLPRTYTFVHGDFNGDGYSDIISSNPNFGRRGRAFMWLGGANMNSTLDMVFYAPASIDEKFGWEKVAGDFNNDGFCDVAISQPWADPAPLRTPGRVHVYLGNAELKDTTVGNEDLTIPSINESSMWDISLSPNPVSTKDQDIKIHFTGSGFKELQTAKIEIYNLRGQMISEYTIDRASLANEQYSVKLHNLNAGVYFLRVSRQDGNFATHRFIVK